MNPTNKLSIKYISEVKKNLKCSSKKRNEILDTLTPEIYNFELEHPNATYDDYITEFNTPKTTAEEYMKELSKKEKFAYLAPRIGTVIAIIALAFVFLIIVCIIQSEDIPGKVYESPVSEVSESDVPEHYYYNDISQK